MKSREEIAAIEDAVEEICEDFPSLRAGLENAHYSSILVRIMCRIDYASNGVGYLKLAKHATLEFVKQLEKDLRKWCEENSDKVITLEDEFGNKVPGGLFADDIPEGLDFEESFEPATDSKNWGMW